MRRPEWQYTCTDLLHNGALHKPHVINFSSTCVYSCSKIDVATSALIACNLIQASLGLTSNKSEAFDQPPRSCALITLI